MNRDPSLSPVEDPTRFHELTPSATSASPAPEAATYDATMEDVSMDDQAGQPSASQASEAAVEAMLVDDVPSSSQESAGGIEPVEPSGTVTPRPVPSPDRAAEAAKAAQADADAKAKADADAKAKADAQRTKFKAHTTDFARALAKSHQLDWSPTPSQVPSAPPSQPPPPSHPRPPSPPLPPLDQRPPGPLLQWTRPPSGRGQGRGQPSQLLRPPTSAPSPRVSRMVPPHHPLSRQPYDPRSDPTLAAASDPSPLDVPDRDPPPVPFAPLPMGPLLALARRSAEAKAKAEAEAKGEGAEKKKNALKAGASDPEVAAMEVEPHPLTGPAPPAAPVAPVAGPAPPAAPVAGPVPPVAPVAPVAAAAPPAAPAQQALRHILASPAALAAPPTVQQRPVTAPAVQRALRDFRDEIKRARSNGAGLRRDDLRRVVQFIRDRWDQRRDIPTSFEDIIRRPDLNINLEGSAYLEERRSRNNNANIAREIVRLQGLTPLDEPGPGARFPITSVTREEPTPVNPTYLSPGVNSFSANWSTLLQALARILDSGVGRELFTEAVRNLPSNSLGNLLLRAIVDDTGSDVIGEHLNVHGDLSNDDGSPNIHPQVARDHGYLLALWIRRWTWARSYYQAMARLWPEPTERPAEPPRNIHTPPRGRAPAPIPQSTSTSAPVAQSPSSAPPVQSSTPPHAPRPSTPAPPSSTPTGRRQTRSQTQTGSASKQPSQTTPVVKKKLRTREVVSSPPPGSRESTPSDRSRPPTPDDLRNERANVETLRRSIDARVKEFDKAYKTKPGEGVQAARDDRERRRAQVGSPSESLLEGSERDLGLRDEDDSLRTPEQLSAFEREFIEEMSDREVEERRGLVAIAREYRSLKDLWHALEDYQDDLDALEKAERELRRKQAQFDEVMKRHRAQARRTTG